MTQKTRVRIILVALMIGLGTIASAAEGEIRLQYKAGDGLKIGDGDNLVHLQSRLQGRFTYTGLEGATDTDGFAVQRGKIKIEGYTLKRTLKFGLQLNAATRARATTAAACTNAACTATANTITAESTSGAPLLEDFYFDWVPVREFGVLAGQYKARYLIQELTSSGKQQFVDRSLGTGPFNFGRDLGVTIHGIVTNRDLGYHLFAMNGDTLNTLNRNRGFLLGSRFELPILGTYLWSESDTDNSESQNLGIGLAYAYNEAVSATQNGTVAAGTKASHGTLDVGYKYHGWSFQGAGMITRTMEGAKLTNWGYHAQLGKFLIPKKVEIAAKTSSVIFSNAVVNQFEHSVGFNYFIAGHGLKLQTDYAFLPNSRGQDLNDNRFRTQMQVIF
ncbi:MAG: hypothetical protein HYT76_02870 [Deltaproteobacteria bacterium]|nr:hypothetical protein [Deltaproteobacteria bacterium]